MRELDLNQVYFDRMGNPLVGRVQFFERGTTTALQVYDSNGVSLGSVLFTNCGKLNPQVFLADADYTIVWEQYKGNGTMASDDDPLHWLPAGSADSLKPVVSLDIENEGLVCVDTINDLRSLDPATLSNHLVVTLLGYNEAGDKPAVNYIWDEDCDEDDDGGAFIKVDGVNGAYKLIIGEELDSKHFGIFPKATINETDVADALALQTAHAYCVANGKHLLLTELNGGVGYYRIASGTYTRIVCQNQNARMMLPDNETATIRQFNGLDFYAYQDTNYEGSWTFSGANLKSSYDASQSGGINWTIFDKFTIDTIEQGHTPDEFTGCDVLFLVPSAKGYTFNACKLNLGKLDTAYNYSFSNMEYTDLYFDDPSQTISVSLENCTMDIDDFVDVKNWVSAKIYLGDEEFDFRGKTLDGNLLLGSAKNYRIFNANIDGMLTLSSNITGKVLRFFNCVFDTITNNSTNNSFQIYDCHIKSDFNVNGGSVDIFNCIVDGDFGGSTCSMITSKATTFNAQVECIELNALSSSFADVVTINASNNIFRCDCNSCRFEKNFVLDSAVGTQNTIQCKWSNNIFDSIASIILQGGTAKDTLNQYIYDNNTYKKNDVWVAGNYSIVTNVVVAEFPQVVLFGFNEHKLKSSYVLEYNTDSVTSHQFTPESVAFIDADFQMNGNTNTPARGKTTGYTYGASFRPLAVHCHIELLD